MAENTDPPRDPEDYSQEGYEMPDDDSFEEQQRRSKGPAVASAPGKTLMIALVAGALVIFFVYQLVFSESEPPPPPTQSQSQNAAPVAESNIPIPTLPAPPPPLPQTAPELEPVPELPPLPELPPPPQEPEIDFSSNAAPTNEQMMARRNSAMLIMSAPPVAGQGQGAVGMSRAERSVATQVGDLNFLVLQGKVIKAVLETAIDSTFPGPVRAIVSRDVFAEAGTNVLIPKGSRLIGNYNADIVRGQARIFILWSRVIRPDGIDIEVNSPSMDQLGRMGQKGHVDNRYFEIFSGALLTSAFSIGLAAAGEAISGDGEVTQTQNTDGSNTSTGDPVSLAVQQSVQNMGNTAQRVLGGIIDARPLITVDQGTPVTVFVNRDLEFPSEIAGGTQIR